MDKLKPCPFCGSEAAEPVFIGNDHTKKRTVTIKCKAPGCTKGVTVGALRFSHEWCHEEAVKKWNTRTVDDELTAANERIATLEAKNQALREALEPLRSPPITEVRAMDNEKSVEGLVSSSISPLIERVVTKKLTQILDVAVKHERRKLAAAEARIAELEKQVFELQSRRENMHYDMLLWRGITPDFDKVCRSCSGSGIKVYGSTSTWRGGIGGQMMTSDVCDKCWGSGKEDRPWLSHRRAAALLKEPPCNE